LSVLDLGNGVGVTFSDALHVLLGEVTEAGVLGAGQERVVGEVPGAAVGHGQDLLEVVLHDHARGVVVLGNDGCSVTHFSRYKLIL
jgi:hypothetical protein